MESIFYRGYTIEPESSGGAPAGTYVYAHEEYDGPEDSRIGWASSIDECKSQIRWALTDHANLIWEILETVETQEKIEAEARADHISNTWYPAAYGICWAKLDVVRTIAKSALEVLQERGEEHA